MRLDILAAIGICFGCMLTPAVCIAGDPPAPDDWLLGPAVSLRSSYVGQAAANPAGGYKQGADFAGQILIGADVDLQQLLGIPGSLFHVTLTERMGQSLARDTIGNSFDVQEVYGGGQTWRLGELTWDQAFAGDRVEVLVGRTFSGPEFGRTPVSCNFQSNDSCPGPKALYQNGSMNAYPVSNWGGRIRLNVRQDLSFLAGAYQVDPDADAPRYHSFDFGFRRSTGAYVPAEILYHPAVGPHALPGFYELGGYYDSSTFNDPYADAQGASSVLTGKPPRVDEGRSGVFLAADQMVTGNGKQGLHVFAVATLASSSQQVQSSFFQLGVLQQGTFPGRDNDAVGFFVADNVFSSSVMNSITNARRLLGGTDRPASNEITGELNYTAQVTNWLMLRPDVQVIINPDQWGGPVRRSNTPTALVFGLTFVVGLPELLGWHFPDLHH